MSSYKFIWKYLKEYKYSYLIGLGFVMVTSVINMVNPFLSGTVVDRVIYNKETNVLIPIVIIMISVVLVKNIIRYKYQMVFEVISQKIILSIRGDLYEKLLALDFGYYNKTRTGDIMARMTGDTDAIRHFIAWVIYNIVDNVCIFIFAIISMSYINLKLTIFMVAICPFIAYFTLKMSNKISPTFTNVREAYSKLNSIVQENISGNRVVKAFAKENYEIEKFEVENKNYRDKNLDSVMITKKYIPILEYLANFLTVIMILVGGILVINKSMTISELVVFNGLLWALNNPMRMAGYLINDTQRFITSTIKIIELLEEEAKIAPKENSIHINNIKGNICFDNVSFKYEKEAALKNISFNVHEGQTVGIIGHTGSGKSTLVNLICRFYDTSSGSIYIDGVDIRDLELRNLRQSIGVAMQDIFLFSDTIEGNIAYGVPRASIEEVRNIATVAEAHEFITDMSDGYDTVVGERGVGLSGGQRQRISLARALIKDPSILILDDTTSAVDMETEFKIQKEVNSDSRKRTSFIIAHRISSVKSADLILVLENGEIIERGNHESLMKNKGYYYNVYRNQFGNFDFEKDVV
ncbi:MAG: ABC transporter ATP-binding protein [Romboutsia sp.]